MLIPRTQEEIKIEKIQYFWDYKLDEKRKEKILINYSCYSSLEELLETEKEELKKKLSIMTFKKNFGFTPFKKRFTLKEAWEFEDYEEKEKFLLEEILIFLDIGDFIEENHEKLYYEIFELNRIEDKWFKYCQSLYHVSDFEKAILNVKKENIDSFLKFISFTRFKGKDSIKDLTSEDYKEMISWEDNSKLNLDDLTFDEKAILIYNSCPITY